MNFNPFCSLQNLHFLTLPYPDSVLESNLMNEMDLYILELYFLDCFPFLYKYSPTTERSFKMNREKIVLCNPVPSWYCKRTDGAHTLFSFSIGMSLVLWKVFFLPSSFHPKHCRRSIANGPISGC